MIRLSPRGVAIYQLLSLIVILLVLYAIGLLLSAIYQLPSHPLAGLVEASGIGRFSERVFKLTVLSGLVAAGIMIAGERLSIRTVIWSRRVCTALVAVSAVVSPFGLSEALDIATSIALLLLLAASVAEGEASVFIRVWQFGLLLAAVSLPAAHFGEGNVSDAIRTFEIQVAYPIAGLAVAFWLMRRYSNVESEWAQDGVRIVAVLVFLAGSLISLGRLSLPSIISLGATPLIPLCFIMLAGHSYRALCSRNENASLAPHWIAVATLFWLVGGGFLGALGIQPAINAAARGTDVYTAQNWLAGWVALAIVLAFINEAATSLRGDNRRVTGYVPLWLITFGAGLASVTQACRGVVQIYLRDVSAVEEAAMAELLLPLTVVWIICLLAVAAGDRHLCFGILAAAAGDPC